jgi:hypothetical protein
MEKDRLNGSIIMSIDDLKYIARVEAPDSLLAVIESKIAQQKSEEMPKYVTVGITCTVVALIFINIFAVHMDSSSVLANSNKTNLYLAETNMLY